MAEAPIFATLGCRLNTYETEAMRALAERAGLRRALVVNSCAVTAEAVRKARQGFRRLRRADPEATLVVTGCAAQIDPASFAAMPEVDRVVGNAEKLRPDTWSALARGEGPRVAAGDILAERAAPAPPTDGFGSRARAYLQVQNGCDHRCTFCIIPFGRGNARSVDAASVVERVRRLVATGYQEVVLTGVDLTAWGGDLPGRPPFGDLVQRILGSVPDLPRLRLSSIDSVEVDDALLDALAEARLMPHLHLSLQHGDDLILKRMKRRHLRDDALRFCEAARARRPDIAFGADLIAGFPTETEAAFENALGMVEACGLTWLHVFPFSPRAGTPAARMPQVAGAAIRARAARLREAGAAAAARYLAAQVGRSHRVLMESPRMGRTEQFAEVDFAADRPVGQIVAATIRGASGRRLEA